VGRFNIIHMGVLVGLQKTNVLYGKTLSNPGTLIREALWVRNTCEN